MGGLIRLAIYFLQVSQVWFSAIRSAKWPRAEAIVTAEPTRFTAFARWTVEVPYTYRVQGELYTGLHQEPSLGGVSSAFLQRFAKGRHFVVRVKPGEPEVSVVRVSDQAHGIGKVLGQ